MICLAFAAALGCGSSERSPAVGSSGTFSGGAGGAQTDVTTGGRAGAGDSSDASTQPSDGGGGSGGSGTTPFDAGGTAGGSGADPIDAGPNDAGGGEEPPAVWSCDGDYAFGADTPLVFGDPTPTGLADALATLTGDAHPISLVLHLEEGSLVGALSATTDNGSGQEIFLPSDVPPLAPVVAAFGSPPGVTSFDPQPNAVLHFVDQVGPVDIQIEHVVWRATQGASCADMTVSLQAVIPTSQFSVVLHLSTLDQTIGELISSSSGSQPTPIGGPAPPPTPVEIAATFEGVPLDFDFDAL